MASRQDQETRSDGVMCFASAGRHLETVGDGIRQFIECLCAEHVHMSALQTTRTYDDRDFPKELQEV